jgi:type I restriction enzyme R subunit
MQAIARVNRVFGSKPGGLVVDYLGLADELRDALATYSKSGGKGDPAHDQAEAVAQLLAVVPTSVVYRRDAGGRLPMAVWGRAKL